MRARLEENDSDGDERKRRWRSGTRPKGRLGGLALLGWEKLTREEEKEGLGWAEEKGGESWAGGILGVEV
jgi:hypothetical protein